MEPINVQETDPEPFADGVLWEELLRVDSLSVGRYVVEAGADDPQEPHTEDEIYYVLAGTGTIRIGDESYPTEPGDVIYVEREVDHEFLEVEERLDLLVVFAPPEGSLDEG